MKTLNRFLLCLTFVSPLHGDELPLSNPDLSFPIPVAVSHDLANVQIPETSDESIRSVIINHLEEIKESGEISSVINTGAYWRGIFVNAGKEYLFEKAEPFIEQAVVAGLRPYNETGFVSGEQFATLALHELQQDEVFTSEEIIDSSNELARKPKRSFPPFPTSK